MRIIVMALSHSGSKYSQRYTIAKLGYCAGHAADTFLTSPA
jgi:hypothetical protein